MGLEIERKFKVKDLSYRQNAVECKYYKQGYISTDKARTIRIRIAGDSAFLTIKSTNRGCTRQEFEYPIPLADAAEMLDTLCLPGIIEKKRYIYRYEGHTWEIDEFLGDNAGLVVAEIELKSESESFQLPPFIGSEVTGDPRYYNSSLSVKPYNTWSEK
ncbi:MAG TPA: CYTH domain-containing protein [Candidatus Barnesiella excrementigallinarum]|nr:CYTH domain-containing protein [Candidatus Barnesiella excrementigallinarum]